MTFGPFTTISGMVVVRTLHNLSSDVLSLNILQLAYIGQLMIGMRTFPAYLASLFIPTSKTVVNRLLDDHKLWSRFQ